jgi:hypothetical protein
MQRLLFFLGGLFFSVLCGAILSVWLPLVAVAVVLVLRILRGRHIRVGAYFLGTALPTVVLLGVFFFGDSVSDYQHRQSFNAELWRNQGQVEQEDIMWPPRLCMVDDLIASGTLDGLTQEEVVGLLGPPEDKSFPLGAVDCDLHYYLGPERGFIRIDSEWLFITFGEDGRVDRYWLYRD